MNKLVTISIASTIAIGTIPALAEVDPKIHKLCLDAKDYSGCIRTHTSLNREAKEKPLENTTREDRAKCPKGCYYSENAGECSFIADSGGSIRDMQILPCSEKSKYQNNNKKHQASCPPGKNLYQKGYLFGLIKGKKLCLTDYEAEDLRRRPSVDFSGSTNSQPTFINCFSNTYGNYTSTSCF